MTGWASSHSSSLSWGASKQASRNHAVAVSDDGDCISESFYIHCDGAPSTASNDSEGGDPLVNSARLPFPRLQPGSGMVESVDVTFTE